MPRLPKPRGFDISDKATDCYDATGQFSHLVAGDVDEAPTAEPGAPGSGEPHGKRAGTERPQERGRPRSSRWWATAAALALIALLAVGLTARGPERRPARPAPRPAPAAVQPAPVTAPGVASPASAAPSTRVRRRRSRPARQRPQPVRRRPRPPVAVAKPRPVPTPAAPMRRPAPAPEPAGGEFILGAR